MAQVVEGHSIHLNAPSTTHDTASAEIKGADAEISHVKTVHFGCFNDRIQTEVQNLQSGLSTLDGAIGELTRQFRKYRKVVSTVGDRYGDDEALMRKIDDLETGKKAIWHQAQDDRDAHRKEMAELRELHTKDLSDLQAKAEAGNQKKLKYEQKIQDLVEKHARAQEKRDQELRHKILESEKEIQQTKEHLEKDNAEKVANLEKTRKELEETSARLVKELHDRTSERDRERELRSCVEEYKKLFEQVHQVVYEHLTYLPEKALQKPAETSEKLCHINRLFEQIPIAESECSMMLRRAIAEHIIIEFMCDKIWRPFFSEYLVSSHVSNSLLPTIHSGMAEAGRDFQHRWKVATLMTLDKLDETHKAKGEHEIGKLVDHQIMEPLRHLLDNPPVFVSAISQIFSKATELGKATERDRMNIIVDNTPYTSQQNSGEWIDWLGGSYEPDYWSDESPSSPASTVTTLSMVVRTDPLSISPKILHQAETDGNIELILPGRAIFPERGIFQEGFLQWQKIRNASSEVARARNGMDRRQSTSTVGLGMNVQSPTKMSTLWGASSLIERE
ncbi:hypothetical protein H2200_008113 [Cladophialophora chaetospira]|uniref:Uncharacterized protein n=1 Tax=Cladophialophora chaetospira TaxID=386627 RepID=A0AA38X5M6_9EURO|nr:hypothetical protein H2200_008113 [Cladophialophora chaetospira]